MEVPPTDNPGHTDPVSLTGLAADASDLLGDLLCAAGGQDQPVESAGCARRPSG